MLNIDTSIDLKQCLLWQYNNSQSLKSLILSKEEWYKQNQEKFWKEWYDHVFNIDTASSFGLNVWGEILGFKRSVKSKDGDLHLLTDRQYRLVLKGQMLKFGMGASAYDVNKWLASVFEGYGQTYCVDTLDMSAIPFVFRATPSQEILWLLSNVDFLPRPAGVGYEIHIIPTSTFGFNGSTLQPFNQGVFNNDYSEEISPIEPGSFQVQISAPEGATVKINGTVQSYVLFEDRTAYTWEVSQPGFITLSGSGVVNNSDELIEIAKIEINSEIQTTSFINNQSAKGAFFLKGKTYQYEYSVSYPDYIPLQGLGTITDTEIINTSYFGVSADLSATVNVNNEAGKRGFIFITGQEQGYYYKVSNPGYIEAEGYGVSGISKKITVAELDYNVTPASANVSLNGQAASRAYFEAGVPFNYTYTANATGYKNLVKTGTTSQSTTIALNLEPAYVADQVIFESNNAGNYNVDILADGLYEFVCVGAGGGGAGYIFNHHYSNSISLYGAVATGGAGGYFRGTFRINAQTLPVTIGAAGNVKNYQIFNTSSSFPSGSVKSTSIATAGGYSSIGNYITSGGGNGGTAGVTNYVTTTRVPTFTTIVGSGGTNTYSGQTTIIKNQTGGIGNAQSQYNLGTGTSSISVSGNGGTNDSGYGWAGGCNASTSASATRNTWNLRASNAGYVKIIFKSL